MKFSPEEFVRAWQTSKDIRDVIRRLQTMSASQANSRASRYRKQGVPLKSFPKTGKRLDISNLKKIAEESLKP